MARTRKRLIYLEPDIDRMVEERAEGLGLSVNEWINRIVAASLAAKGRSLKITTTYEVDL